MQNIPILSSFRSAPLTASTLTILTMLALHPLCAQAQGQFAGVRVNGIDVVVDQKSPARDPAEQQRLDQQLTMQSVSASELLRSGGQSGPAKQGTPRYRSVYRNDGLFTSAALCSPLQDSRIRAAVDQALRSIVVEQINQQMGGNVVHSSSNHQLGPTCTAHAEVVGNRLTVKMTIPRNRVFVRIMTPDAEVLGIKVGVSGEADPNFFTHYDLDASATFLLPKDTGGQVRQESVSYVVRNIDRPQSRSVTGKVAIAMNDVIGFLGGQDYIARIRQDRTGRIGSLVSVDLGPLHRALGGIAPPRMRIDTTHQGGMLVMQATQQPPAPRAVVN